MKFDVFFSISQTPVDGHCPTEKVMFENFFDQVTLADELGFGTAWVAETHLSTETQKENKKPVVPHFQGEIGLNTDILQLAQSIFSRTKKINVGSAIMNILCNGGPLAHAERIKTFLSLHELSPYKDRELNIGFASGRFDFSNRPYGIIPRNEFEEQAWPAVKGKILSEATEIFLRALKGDSFSTQDLTEQVLVRENFRSDDDWSKAKAAYGESNDKLKVQPRWNFEKVGIIPREASLEKLNLILGSHDEQLQKFANTILPVRTFNLSITPPEVIEKTHKRMAAEYHKSGGSWQREYMPRTAMVFIDHTKDLSAQEQSKAAKSRARLAWENYWKAMEGTIDSKKVEAAVENTIAGNPGEVADIIKKKYHPDDRLMLWFDFNCHDNELIKQSLKWFKNEVIPQLNEGGS